MIRKQKAKHLFQSRIVREFRESQVLGFFYVRILCNGAPSKSRNSMQTNKSPSQHIIAISQSFRFGYPNHTQPHTHTPTPIIPVTIPPKIDPSQFSPLPLQPVPKQFLTKEKSKYIVLPKKKTSLLPIQASACKPQTRFPSQPRKAGFAFSLRSGGLIQSRKFFAPSHRIGYSKDGGVS
jgi:hypothetical protein